MGRQVLVSLLESIVFLDVVKIVTSDDNGSLHLHAPDNASQYAASDTDITREWTLLVNVCALYSL